MELQARQALHNILPETLDTYGTGAAKWFTTTALAMFQDTIWDRASGEMITGNEEAMTLRKHGHQSLPRLPRDTRAPAEPPIHQHTPASLNLEHINKIGGCNIASFGNLYGRDTDKKLLPSMLQE